MKIKKYLNGKEFISELRQFFKVVPDHRKVHAIPMQDILSSAMAIFQLKLPSLLQMDKMRNSQNFKNLFQVDFVPSDTQLREVLDKVDTAHLRGAFKVIFNRLQQGKVLEKFKFIEDYFLVSSDGTGVFSSNKVHCESCLARYSKSTGELNYQHQMLGVSIVHPERKTVIPLCPEMIKNEDGFSKNDCERNASKRMWMKFREDHPKLKVIALEDGLCANGPHIELLGRLDIRYIITAKEQSNSSVFRSMEKRRESLEDVQVVSKVSAVGVKIKKRLERTYEFVNKVPLSDQKGAPSVNLLKFIEILSWENSRGEHKQKVLNHAWVTDLELNTLNVERIAQAGRSRWKTENETFNTLKNQGYNFEHNYGHGYRNLCSNFTMMMLLAFLFDQALEASCDYYQEIRRLCRTKYNMWEALRSIFKYFEVQDWNNFLIIIIEKESNTS